MHDFDSEFNERENRDFNMNRPYPLSLLKWRFCQ